MKKVKVVIWLGNLNWLILLVQSKKLRDGKKTGEDDFGK